MQDDPIRPLYDALAVHQVNEASWHYQDVIRQFQRWRGIFDSEFKLNLPPTVFRIGGASSNCYGHFRPGPNDFGLPREIAFNERHLAARLAMGEFWRALGTLLHELLHAWQDEHGRPSDWNYHNLEFRNKAESLGLLITARGVTDYAQQSPFFNLLAKHDIELPQIEVATPRIAVARGRSKLKKWSCKCTNVRVAVPNFRAKCLNCGQLFERRD